MKALVWPVATYRPYTAVRAGLSEKNEETRLDAFEMKGLMQKDSAGVVDSKENK